MSRRCWVRTPLKAPSSPKAAVLQRGRITGQSSEAIHEIAAQLRDTARQPPQGLANDAHATTLWQLIKEVWRVVEKDKCTSLAAQMSYHFALSLFPFLLALAALVGSLAFSDAWGNVLAWVAQYLPPQSRSLVIDTIRGLTYGRTSFFSIGLVGTVWAASSGLLSLMESLNTIYNADETRSFWRRLGLAILVLLVLSLLLLLSFALATIGTRAGQWLDQRMALGFWFHLVWKAVSWSVSLILVGLSMAIVDYALPNLRRRWRWVTPGSAFVVLAWVLASAAFNFYVTHIASYHRVYGGLGAFVILMVWIYIFSLITLIGTEVNCVLARAGKLSLRSGAAV